MSETPAKKTAEQIPVESIKGVGPRVSEKLAKLGIYTLQDLLFHLPTRYQDRTTVKPIGSLRAGMEASIIGTVDLSEVVFRKKRMLIARISDGTGSIQLRFFNFNHQQQAQLSRGNRLRCFGEVRYVQQHLEMAHPEFHLLNGNDDDTGEKHLTPIYPVTEGLHQIGLRNIIRNGLILHERFPIRECLPEELLRNHSHTSINDAVRYLHQPAPDDHELLREDTHNPAALHLAFEELVAHQLSMRKLRKKVRQHAGIELATKGELFTRLKDSLPFPLTNAQLRVIKEIQSDLNKAQPMLRLVQGDVGAGKTIVAAAACLQTVEAGYQASLMAPTELLAEQHYRNFSAMLEPLNLGIAWLSGQQKAADRRTALEKIASGHANIVIGTHALFQESVEFHNLALVIVDEQHRFGVHQRLALTQKGMNGDVYPHQLTMTATPIPRTLSMTAYADLDVSVIDELPPGRKPIKTVVIPDNRRHEIVERVQRVCQLGQQVYWVCTLIEESEALQCQAAEETASQLQEALPGVKVGLVHGRMKATDKETTMNAFKQGDIQLLVATTVIEVGVDVPNATLMIIENAERLGLAQLHQLRGRVGRGAQESNCVLLYKPPLSRNGKERLAILRETQDGFRISQKDLELRGPGELLGTRQTGQLQFRIANLMRDQHLLPEAQKTADQLLSTYPDRVEPLIQRWLGQATQYGNV